MFGADCRLLGGCEETGSREPRPKEGTDPHASGLVYHPALICAYTVELLPLATSCKPGS